MAVSKRKQDPFILKLIGEVEAHDCLWNSQNKEFYSKAGTARAWLDIAAKMKRDVSVIRAKWKNIKDTYRKEIKKITMDPEYQCFYLYFEELSFLRDSLSPDEKTDKNDRANEETKEVYLEEDISQYYQEEQHEEVNYLIVRNEESPPVKRRKKERETIEATVVPKQMDDEEHYDEQFLVSLLPFFRRLEPIRKLMIRSKIQQAMIDEITRNRQ